MNPWTAILDPRSLMPREQARGRRHILSGAADPVTLEPASKPGPKATPAPTPIPRKAEPTITVDEWRDALPPNESYQPMPYQVAILIRERARMRQPVPAYLLEEANQVVEEKREEATKGAYQ